MSYAARSQSQEAEWNLVSETHPCSICNAAEGCHRDLEGAFVCCARHPSDWPLTSGAWLHRVERAEHGGGSTIASFASRPELHHGRIPMFGSTS